MKNLLAIVLVSFLFGCVQQKKQDIPKDVPKALVYVTPAGDKIIFLEDYYRSYMEDIKAHYANRNKIYEKEINDTVFKKYFSNSEYADFVKLRLSFPILDTTGLLNCVFEVTNNHQKMEDIITAALKQSKKYLKNDSITIYILPSNSDIAKITKGFRGVSGITAGSKQIILTVDPGISSWEEMLSYNVARQYNCAYWTKMNFKSGQRTLLNYLVFEGRADSYAHFIYPDIDCPWTRVLTKDAEYEFWNKIKSQVNNRDIAYQYSVMFGAKSEYPLWGGYTLGYHIVQSVLKSHPKLSPAEWTNLSPEKILEMSDYK